MRHYVERTRPNGQTIRIKGSPPPQSGWVTVYIAITHTKQSEMLLRAGSAELSDQLLAHAEQLPATNHEFAATITAYCEAERQLAKIAARTRITTQRLPAHIAQVAANGIYTCSNHRLGSVMPRRDRNIIRKRISDALGASACDRIDPHLQVPCKGSSPVFEFNDEYSSCGIRVALKPDPNVVSSLKKPRPALHSDQPDAAPWPLR